MKKNEKKVFYNSKKPIFFIGYSTFKQVLGSSQIEIQFSYWFLVQFLDWKSMGMKFSDQWIEN